ncbi:MAG: hypothetical protein JWP20_1531 [Roseomonas sp.]|jgi:uncharacterized protein (TIGR00369 family)|nr:hypothetical protein [Roseomonas sp.]
MNDEPFPAASAPYHQLLGMTLEEWRDGFARVVLEAGPAHMNRSDIVHGGVILSMIDQAAGFCGLWCSVPGNIRKAVTIDLDCRFTGQTTAGRMVAEGKLVSRGRNIYFARTEVFNAAGEMVAFGSSTHRWRAGSETVEGSPGA